MASSVARQNPCPVLLVPPSLWDGQAHAPRLEKVMVATDFHESSSEAARWSTEHFAPEAEHLLVHVLEMPEPPGVLAGRYGSRVELLRTAGEGAQQRLEKLRIGLSPEPHLGEAPPLSTMVREGQPAGEIVRLADETDVDLIVVGGRSDRERSAWNMLGTTAERVLRASHIPVLVARGLPDGPPRNLLVAVDGSKPSLRALAWADFLRRRFGGSCTALHVESPVIFEYADSTPSGVDAAVYGTGTAAPDSAPKAKWIRVREKWLRDEVDRAGVDADAIALRVSIGRPADKILAEQERGGADLIVMGTHGGGMLVRALLGSVASEVLHRSPCSVLVMGDLERANV
jgi:nucleotide-binding universal stress UspA family protein